MLSLGFPARCKTEIICSVHCEKVCHSAASLACFFATKLTHSPVEHCGVPVNSQYQFSFKLKFSFVACCSCTFTMPPRITVAASTKEPLPCCKRSQCLTSLYRSVVERDFLLIDSTSTTAAAIIDAEDPIPAPIGN